jgi:hypothetical protein
MPAIAQMTHFTDKLRTEHNKVKRLVREFEVAGRGRRKAIVLETVALLKFLEMVENRILFSEAEELSEEAREIVLRRREANNLMRNIINEIENLPYSERTFAKFMNLADAVRAHYREEESELFPIFDRSDVNQEELAEKMQKLKTTWRTKQLVSKVNGVGGVVGVIAAIGLGWLAYSKLSSKSYTKSY